MLTEKSQLCTSETKRTDNKIISYTHDDEDLNQEKEEYDFIGSQRDKYIESQRNNRNGNILTNCTSTTTENAAVKIFHRRCPYCHTESHVRIAVCKGCSYKFPIKDEETDALVMRGKKAKEGNNTHKMLGRIRKDIIKLYGARIHACLLFTTLYNPSRQRSGYKAHSPFVTKVMEDMEFSLLKAFIKAVREAYLKGPEMLPDSNEADVTGQHVAGICFDFDLHRYNLSSSLSHSVCATNANVSGTNQTEGGFLSENTDGAEKLAEPAPNNSRRTLSKTYYDLKLLKEFLLTENENRDIYQIPPAELSPLLCKFFILARKKDGTDYEPGSLRNFLSSFDRYLRSHGYSYSLVGSTDFAQVRQVLNAKQSELKREGKGNQPMKTEAISDFEINVLWESGQLGCKTPESIINSLWFFNTVHFGLRGSDQHRSLCWGDISLCSTSSGEQYLVFDERQSKKSHDVKTVNSKMWENRENPDRCPINIYKVYASKRPSDYCDPYTPFYIATHQGSITEEDKWFRRQPIGKNKLTGIMKNMARAAGLDKNISNHSARKYISQKMKNTASPI